MIKIQQPPRKRVKLSFQEKPDPQNYFQFLILN